MSEGEQEFLFLQKHRQPIRHYFDDDDWKVVSARVTEELKEEMMSGCIARSLPPLVESLPANDQYRVKTEALLKKSCERAWSDYLTDMKTVLVPPRLMPHQLDTRSTNAWGLQKPLYGMTSVPAQIPATPLVFANGQTFDDVKAGYMDRAASVFKN
eukprot:TRINITY_DN15_c0_g1_i1.p1 TRINITY_DN15_c0_g1~~TRINITY_DN15_c0_g1_i1.p1  ORF type:complete len:156 (-),score=26.80 TRINITY_DN15_c0_g1_i1:183-650(-)